MIIEYTIHKYHRHDGDHNVSISGDAALSMARAMRQQDVFSLGHHKLLGITVTKIEDETHGIDSTGAPFAYDTEPLPLLNPSL